MTNSLGLWVGGPTPRNLKAVPMHLHALITATILSWAASLGLAATEMITMTPLWLGPLVAMLVLAAALTIITVVRKEARILRRLVWATREPEAQQASVLHLVHK